MKENTQNEMNNLSYKDMAYLILEEKNGGINTLDLFTEIINRLNLPSKEIDTKIADFYTSLTTDKRFLMIDGLWDLRRRHTSDKLLSQVEDEEEEEEESIDEIDEDELDNSSFDDADDIDDTSYDDDDDNGLSDLVVLDEDELDHDN